MAGIGQAISQLSALQTHFLKSLLEGLPEASKRHLDAQCFSPLERLASANWEEELRRQGRGELVGTDDYRYVSIEGAHVTIMIDPRTKPIWGQMSDFLLGEEVPTSEAC